MGLSRGADFHVAQAHDELGDEARKHPAEPVEIRDDFAQMIVDVVEQVQSLFPRASPQRSQPSQGKFDGEICIRPGYCHYQNHNAPNFVDHTLLA